MKKMRKPNPLSRPATKRDLERLEKKIEKSFDQLVVSLTAVLKLMQRAGGRSGQRKRSR